MDAEIIMRHNAVVRAEDTVIYAGDFYLGTKGAEYYINQLNGKHVFLEGSHDRWLKDDFAQRIHAKQIWQRNFDDCSIVVCHYALRVWHKSHYNSWMLYGHSHGRLPPVGKQHDIGVDNNNFYPVSLDQIKGIMKTREDNPNLIKGERHGIHD